MPSYTLSSAGYQQLLKLEGNIPYVYDDARGSRYYPKNWSDFKGHPTIGLGILIQEADKPRLTPYLNGKKAPSDLISKMNSSKIQQFADVLNARLTSDAVPQEAFDALFHHAWNTGLYSKSTRAAGEAINRGDWEAAARAFASGPTTSKGRWVPALAQRRAAEALALRTLLSASVQRAKQHVQQTVQTVEDYSWEMGLATAGILLCIVGVVVRQRRLAQLRMTPLPEEQIQ